LPYFIELDNRVFDRFSPQEREKIGVHVCPGGDVDSVHSADVPYEELLKHLFKLNAGYFQLQMASERDRESAYKLVGKYLRDDAKGIPQMAYIGCIVTQSPRAESVQEVCDQLVAAAEYIDKQRIGSTDDCGFSPFSIDKKPNHGSPDYARDIAFQKIANRVAGTKMAAEKLGVH
jgi:methionine synthase II (cobalamin-independent)